jgi:hypothetical protein
METTMKNKNKDHIANAVPIQNKLPAGVLGMLWIIDTVGNLGGIAGWAAENLGRLV